MTFNYLRCTERATNPWKNKNIPDWRGCEFYSLTERKHGIVIFLTLRLTAASTKPDFCFLLTLIVKNAVHLGDGDI